MRKKEETGRPLYSIFLACAFLFCFYSLDIFLYLSHQKLDGCNKMTCTGCMQYFCWICMGSLSRANPYKHFTDPASPCFNRYVYTVQSPWYFICGPLCLENSLTYFFSCMWTFYFLENELMMKNVLSGNFIFYPPQFFIVKLFKHTEEVKVERV